MRLGLMKGLDQEGL